MITPDQIVPTTCPYCGVGCNLELHVKDDFIYQVTSNFDSVVNRGNLCVKGRFGYDFIDHPARITTPLIRKEPQEPGKRTQAFSLDDWVTVSWEEALNYTAQRLVEIYQQSGPGALAAYACAKATNEDNYLLQKLFRSIFRTNNIDHCTRLCHAGSVAALQRAIGSSAMSNTASEVAQSDVFIITGSNTSENHPIIALQMKAAILKHGAQLIVVDPRRIELCDLAKVWLQIKPGTNVPVFSAMANVIIKENLVNWDFVQSRTEGFDAFKQSIEEFTPEFAEQVSGAPAELIIEAAHLYANAKTAAIYWGMGISQLSHGTSSALAVIHLAFLTGHIGRPGTGLNPLRGQNNVQGASDMGAMPYHYPGYMLVDDPANASHWEKAWHMDPGSLSLQRGLTTTEILANTGSHGIRSLYIMGENPMMTEPNLNQTRHHMEQLEFLAVQDLFINESGAFADVFLPAVSFAEKDGTFTNTDRRVQRVRSAVHHRGSARPDWDILCDLARRLSSLLDCETPSRWHFNHPSEIMEEISRNVPEYRGIHYPRIEASGLQTPVWDDTHPGTPYLFEDSFPSGKGKFHPLEFVPVAEPVDEEYPMILTTGRLLEHWHGGTLTRHSELDTLYPQPMIEINPVDATMLGIGDYESVRVASRRGEIFLRAKISEATSPGVVFIPFHFHEAAANLLTIDALDPLAKIPEFKACAVNLSHVDQNQLINPSYVKRGRR